VHINERKADIEEQGIMFGYTSNEMEDSSEAELKGNMVMVCCGLNQSLNVDLEIMSETCITSLIPMTKYLCKEDAEVSVYFLLRLSEGGPEE